MSISDALKDSFLDSGLFATELTPEMILLMLQSLGLSILFGVAIYFIYQKAFRGVLYNKSFAITLAGMTILTCAITLAISTNVVISLGMVGALSIVRYRTAVKEPMDLMFLFWAIGMGIVLGAQAYFLAIAASVAMVLLLLLVNRKNGAPGVYIMILHYAGEDVTDALKQQLAGHKYQIKSKTLRGDTFELAVEVSVRHQNLAFVDRVRELPGVDALTVVQYNGEYHG